MVEEGTLAAQTAAYARPPNAPIRCLGALAVVWALSFAVYPLHLTALVAAVWIIATLVLVPIGTTLTDRIVAFLLLAAAPAVLIAWFTPFVSWLVSPPVLTALLGTLVALAWGLGWTRRPVARIQDWATIALAVLTAAFFWIPFASGGLARAIGVLSQGYDAAAHYFMWVRVWANHGYLVFNTLPDPDAWNWRVYPQGPQALLAGIGTVLTGDSKPPTQIDQSVALFAILVALQAGALALVTAWSVDRLSRCRKKANWRRVVIFQIFAVLLVAIGPGSVVSVQSLSFTTGLVVIIPALALAATAGRCPRRDGLLVGASLIAAAAVYPICALTAVVLWPLYLWASRRFWQASKRRRWYAAGWTVIVGLLSAPTFVLLVLRNLDHDWNTFGGFQALNGGVYAGTAILLALLIVFARGRLPKAVQYALWMAATVSIALIAEVILQWITVGDPTYYTIKTIYLGWMLSVIAVTAGLACIRRRRVSAVRPVGQLLPRIIVGLTAGVVVIGSLAAAVLSDGLDQPGWNRNWTQAVSKEGWVISTVYWFDGYGWLAVEAAQYAAQHDGVTVVVPCDAPNSVLLTKWTAFLSGGMNERETDVAAATCSADKENPLGFLPAYLRDHPEIAVNVFTTDQKVYEHALEVKEVLKLSNLEVVPPPANSEGPGS